MESNELNAASLKRELDWLEIVISRRFCIYFNQEGDKTEIYSIKPPDLSFDSSVFSTTIKNLNLLFE
jgi:hypothetical protein